MAESLYLSWPDLGGGALRVAREARGVSREELAAKIGGLGAGAIANAENGHRPASSRRLSEWADALGMSEGPFHRLRDIADGRQRIGADITVLPADPGARRQVLTEAVRRELSDIVADTDADLLPSVSNPDEPIAFHVRLPDGEIREVRAERRLLVPSKRSPGGGGPTLQGYLAALASLDRDPSKSWPGRRNEEVRLSLVIVESMRVMRADELNRLRGYVERILEERE